MLQITPKSRSEIPEYDHMQRELAEEVGRINGKFGDVDWTPLRYINKPMSHAALAGFYRMSRVGLVTPLRDGMNLVAKEYVAAQNPSDPGVLVLSEFAGAARELGTEGSPQATAALREALLNDKFWGVQSDAATALGSIRTNAALDALLEGLKLTHPKARRAVARTGPSGERARTSTPPARQRTSVTSVRSQSWVPRANAETRAP